MYDKTFDTCVRADLFIIRVQIICKVCGHQLRYYTEMVHRKLTRLAIISTGEGIG